LTLIILVVSLGGACTGRAQESDENVLAQELYEQARQALNEDEYRRAATRFRNVYEEYESSRYAADALYWRAFALYRLDRSKYLRRALEALELRRERFPEAAMRDEARDLATRLRGELARRGDADAAERVARAAEHETQHDEELKMATLQALLNMKSDRAVPLLQKVLPQTDSSAELRCQAVFLLAEHGETDEVADTLLEVYRNDPDPKVRQNAIFWLSQVPGDETLAILEEVVTTAEDDEERTNALFALQEHDSDRAAEILRDVARDRNQPEEVRENAIFWIGQRGGRSEIEFLMQLYDDLDADLRENVLFSISESDHDDAGEWLVRIAGDEDEDIELRKTALFWLGQNHDLPIAQIMAFYEGADREMKEQVIFLLSNRGGKEALHELVKIVRNERDTELRSNAVFWIGQFDDPEAEAVLLEIIEE